MLNVEVGNRFIILSPPASPVTCSCDYPGRPSDCGAQHAAGDLQSLIDDIDRYRAPNVRGNDILLNFGDDFTWEVGGLFSVFVACSVPRWLIIAVFSAL